MEKAGGGGWGTKRKKVITKRGFPEKEVLTYVSGRIHSAKKLVVELRASRTLPTYRSDRSLLSHSLALLSLLSIVALRINGDAPLIAHGLSKWALLYEADIRSMRERRPGGQVLGYYMNVKELTMLTEAPYSDTLTWSESKERTCSQRRPSVSKSPSTEPLDQPSWSVWASQKSSYEAFPQNSDIVPNTSFHDHDDNALAIALSEGHHQDLEVMYAMAMPAQSEEVVVVVMAAMLSLGGLPASTSVTEQSGPFQSNPQLAKMRSPNMPRLRKFLRIACEPPLGVITLNDIERLSEHALIGLHFSDLISQALLALCKHLPPRGKELKISGLLINPLPLPSPMNETKRGREGCFLSLTSGRYLW
ncbi:hypothetical protein VNO77_42058 [Canavalia gladiata]|uniref:Uncharacterized protein n=1 Tax=Canavalia gladiata TaxID=3824 RepID=A0AAN9K0X5_CANGL